MFVAVVMPMTSVAEEDIKGVVSLLSIEETIGPATDDYVGRALESAAQRRAQLVVFPWVGNIWTLNMLFSYG